eukprot:IDg16156t1
MAVSAPRREDSLSARFSAAVPAPNLTGVQISAATRLACYVARFCLCHGRQPNVLRCKCRHKMWRHPIGRARMVQCILSEAGCRPTSRHVNIINYRAFVIAVIAARIASLRALRATTLHATVTTAALRCHTLHLFPSNLRFNFATR